MRLDQLYDILISPVLSEKATTAADQFNKHIFKVHDAANKKQVATAVERIFGVKVAKVNIVMRPAKKRIFKGRKGLRSGCKKAIVTLLPGETLNVMSI